MYARFASKKKNLTSILFTTAFFCCTFIGGLSAANNGIVNPFP